MGNNYNNLCNIIILFLALCFLAYKANADTIEYGQNLYTLHLWDREENFEHKVDSKGILITNPMGYLRINNIAFLKGRDSVNSKVYGGMYFMPLYYGELFIGAYSHNVKDWRVAEIDNNFAIKGDNWGVIAILGFNAPFTILEWKEEQIKLKMNNIITPATINSFISIQKEF